MSSFDRLISQIDAFIRKFYKNQIIKGLFLFVGVLLVTYLLVITLEYFGRFGSFVRGALFFGFIFLNIFILGKFIALPLLRLKSYGGRINRAQASSIIGSFFPKVSDRLLNTLQLSKQMDQNSTDFELLNASVQQRSETMEKVPFSEAINFNENRKYIVWVLPIIVFMFILGVFSPAIYKQGTERVVNFTEEFIPEAPFSFSLLSPIKSIEEGSDYSIELQLEGVDLPEKVYVKWKQGRFLLERNAKNLFIGELPRLQTNTKFQFEAPFKGQVFKSDVFSISVIDKTIIGKMQATLIYPNYLGMKNETIENSSDLSIPEGTQVRWSVLTKNAKYVEFWINNEQEKFTSDGFELSRMFRNDSEGKIVLANKSSNKIDTSSFQIDVLKDNYPGINVEEVQDTIKDGVRYFSGVLNDTTD